MSGMVAGHLAFSLGVCVWFRGVLCVGLYGCVQGFVSPSM